MFAIMRSPTRAARRRPKGKTRGQSLVEFALVLPILLTLVGAAVDIARIYGGWVALDGATRDAAEQVATDTTITSQSAAAAKAQTIVCAQLTNAPGFSAPAGNPTACTSPSLTVTWASTTASPGSTRYPLVTVTVASSLPFRTFFGYPLFTQNGAWTIGSNQSYSILQGR